MTCKFVLKCSIREKWLVDNNELIKTVAEIFSVKIVFVFSYIYIYIDTYIYMYITGHNIQYICIYMYIYGHIWSYIYHIYDLYESCSEGFETTTTEFCSDVLTNWAIRPWLQLALRTNFANFVQLLQFHFLFSVIFHFGYCLRQLPRLFSRSIVI